MRTQKTVLILGAGASKGFGLPLGEDLKSNIANDLRIFFSKFGSNLESGSYEIVEALRILVRNKETGQSGDINPLRHVAVRISEAMGPSGSIDEYVERHRNDPKYAQCAKLAIAKSVLQGERKSSIFKDYSRTNENIVGNNSGSWMSMMLRDMTKRLSADEISKAFRNLFIINFNYDRCFENFVFLWIKQMYGLEDGQAAQVCAQISIYHPYGKIGNLPHENPPNHIPFGEKVSGERLVSIASNIRTFSESAQDEDNLSAARTALSEAKKVVFMGFAFHQQNMDVLTIPGSFERQTLRCYATTKDISDPRIELDKESISTAFRIINPGGLFFDYVSNTCEEFWRQYGEVVSK